MFNDDTITLYMPLLGDHRIKATFKITGDLRTFSGECDICVWHGGT